MPLIETPLGLALAFLAGFIAAAVNAVAGGGSLVSFPTLVALGLPEQPANATNGVALWPGSAAGAFGFIKHLKKTKKHLKLLIPPTAIGSILGALLLVATGQELFKTVVPFLILLATFLLAFQPKIKEFAKAGKLKTGPILVAFLQFLIALYGGYFGAGMGIMMLGVMSLYIDGDLHELNAIKNWLAVVINFGSSVILIANGLVILLPALAVMAGALIGGYTSASLVQKIDPEKARKVVVAYGFIMTAWYFWSVFKP